MTSCRFLWILADSCGSLSWLWCDLRPPLKRHCSSSFLSGQIGKRITYVILFPICPLKKDEEQ